MKNGEKIKAVEMVRRIRDEQYAEIRHLSADQKVAYFRRKARALHRALGVRPSKKTKTA
jgi:hypothetical protein